MKRLLLLSLLVTACKDKPAAPAQSSPPTTPDQPSDAVANASTAPASTGEEAPVPQFKTDMPSAAEIAPLVKANNTFALELWRHAGAGNTAISPASISMALAMTWAGAKGKTADEMRETMHLEGAIDVLVSQWGRLSYALQDPARPLKLAIANRIYGDAQYQFDTTYFAITRKAFNAPLDMVDFRGDPEAARAKINAWVADRTEQRIENVLPPRSVDAETRLVIVNALYFLADWAEPFAKAQTYDEPFYVGGRRATPVPTMHRQGRYMHAASDGAALLELPYKGGSAAMYILLPDQRDGLAALEKDLAATLKALQRKLAETTVLVSLPRFTIDPPASLDLAKPLQALGMKEAFDPAKADFTGIAKATDGDRLFIGAVLHKAFVKVDEKGTEAAAATAVAMPRGGPPPKATPFKADHPFVFVIVERTTGLILFVGRVVEPKAG